MNILIVDDSRIMRNIVKNSLLKNKNFIFSAIEADNGEDAFDLIEKGGIDLLLLDWNMPRLNGLELVQKLRSMDEYQKLPIIMITSEAAKYNVIEAVKAGVNDYLIKPIQDKDLMKKIEQVLTVVR